MPDISAPDSGGHAGVPAFRRRAQQLRACALRHLKSRERGWGISKAAIDFLRRPPLWFVLLAAIVAVGALFYCLVPLHRAFRVLWYSTKIDADKLAEATRNLVLTVAGIAAVPFLVWRTYTTHRQASIARETHLTTLFTKAVEQLGAVRSETSTKSTRREIVGRTGKEAGTDGETGVETGQGEEIHTGHETEVETSRKVLLPAQELRIGAAYALQRVARDFARDTPIDATSVVETLAAYVRRRCAEREKKEIRDEDGEPEDVQAALRVLGRLRRRFVPSEPPNTLVDLRGIRYLGHRLAATDFVGVDANGSVFDLIAFDRVRFLAGTTIEGVHFKSASTVTPRPATGPAGDDHGSLLFVSAFGSNAHFENASLFDLRMTDTKFDGAVFSYSELIRLIARGRCDFVGARFIAADLTLSDFGDSDLSRADLGDALLQKTRLSQATGLTTEQLAAAWGDLETELPGDVERPTNERWLRPGQDHAEWEARWGQEREKYSEPAGIPDIDPGA